MDKDLKQKKTNHMIRFLNKVKHITLEDEHTEQKRTPIHQLNVHVKQVSQTHTLYNLDQIKSELISNPIRCQKYNYSLDSCV